MHECSSRLASCFRFFLSRVSALAESQRPKRIPKYARLRRTRSTQFSSTAHDSLHESSTTLRARRSKSVPALTCFFPMFSCTHPPANRNKIFLSMPCSWVPSFPETPIVCPRPIRASYFFTACRAENGLRPSPPEPSDEPRLPSHRLEPAKASVRHGARNRRASLCGAFRRYRFRALSDSDCRNADHSRCRFGRIFSFARGALHRPAVPARFALPALALQPPPPRRRDLFIGPHPRNVRHRAVPQPRRQEPVDQPLYFKSGFFQPSRFSLS